MYVSKEIRWFSQTESKAISNWFARQGIDFTNVRPRTDFYLPIAERGDMSVKLREGNIEIKQRHGRSLLTELTKNAVGHIEDWVKWSFTADKEDLFSREIIKEKKYKWVAVDKLRLGVKLTQDKNGATTISPITDTVSFGCQLEYTKLLVDGQAWFTFGVEWFGDTFIELDIKLIEEVLLNTQMAAKDSMGYNEFLNKITA